MKNWIKKGAAVALSAVMAVSLAACASSKPATPEEVIQAAQTKLAEAKSLSYEMDSTMGISASGQSIQMKMTGTIDSITEPMAMQIDMTMDMGAYGSMNTKMYVKEEDGVYTVYAGTDDGSGNITWSAQAMTDVQQLEQYNAQDSMDLYLNSAANFQENGTETINGKEAVRYDGVIGNDSLNEVITSTGVMDQFSGLGLDSATIESMLTDIGDLPVSIWIDQDSGVPVKYDMDMTEMMQTMMTKAMESAGSTDVITVDTVLFSMIIRSIDSIESIEIPQEALDSAA